MYTLGLAGRRDYLLRDNGIPVLKVWRCQGAGEIS